MKATPSNDLSNRDAQRRTARATVPSRLPPSPRTGTAQTQLIKRGK